MKQLSYISRDLTHFVGRHLPNLDQRFDLFCEIVREGRLRSPQQSTTAATMEIDGSADLCSHEMYRPGIVCFCDIPFEGLGIHVSKYGPFGIAFRKDFLVAQGANPVIYVSNRTGQSRFQATAKRVVSIMARKSSTWREGYTSDGGTGSSLDEDTRDLAEITSFLNGSVFAFVKCFDHRLPADHPDNYYMERMAGVG